MLKKRHLSVCWAIAAVACIPYAYSKPIDVELPYKEFGHLSQGLGDLCLSTSMINSFRFLENHYPKIYGNKLTGTTDQDLEDARNRLLGGYTLPDGTKRPGTGCPSKNFTFQQIWEAKLHYIDDFAPGTTIYAGMQKIDTITGKDLDTSGWYKGESLSKSNPTFEFLLKELMDGEDIEFGWRGGNFDHEMTLTSLHLDDKNDDGKLTAGETASIDFIDPDDPSKTKTGANLAVDKDGFLIFDYDDGKGTRVKGAQIYSAYAESPKRGPGRIPEPDTLILLTLGGSLLLLQRKRRVCLPAA